MAAGSLAAGQDNAHNLLPGFGGILTLLEGDLVLAVGVGEQRLDLLLIGNAFRGLAVLYANLGNAVAQHARELGLVLISCHLKRRKLHMKHSLQLI